MKKLFFITFIVAITSGCNKLTDVLDRQPPNNLVPENVATTAAGARNLLNGAYAILHEQYYYMFTEFVPSVMAGTMQRNGIIIDLQYQDNAVRPNNSSVDDYWMTFYKMINQANWVIQLVERLPASEMGQTEKNEFFGQARALRAMAHFDALRYFGQFYDLNSAYGIINKSEPANYTRRNAPRNTVAENYEFILSDLDYAIENAPNFSKPIYMSKTSAKALKARVLLYMGRYADAADLADEVITDGTRTLSPTFAAVFSTGFNSTEMIFMRSTDAVTFAADRKKLTYAGSVHALAGAYLRNVMAGDPRVPQTYNTANNNIIKVYNTAFNVPTYYLRLAEMYLIKAEGLARTPSATLDEAKEPLERIRQRAFGVPTPSAATTKEELLEEIYLEIIKELSFENGADWFAAIRFNKIMTIKPTVNNVNKYILPIPDAEILSNTEFGPQNPGYEQ